MRVLPLTTPADWACAAAALPASRPLPSRTVLVGSERHAHALRRALVRGGNPRALAGTRFRTPFQAAVEVLERVGEPFTPGEAALRPARLLALFREDLPLEHFPLDLLRSRPGWDEAFAAAMGTLEAAGLAPADLPTDGAHARDLSLLWSRVVAEAGRSWTAARIFAEAAAALERDARAWPHDGPVLAAATGHENASLARFIRAIPDLTLGVWVARPARERHLQRIDKLFGPQARSAAIGPGSPSLGGEPSERDLLATFLFQPPGTLGSPTRPRSRGPDGTVHLEEHAGVDAEVEAAVGWVSRQVLEEELPLEEIAVLVPVQDPLAQLVAERLERLPFGGGTLPVHVASGLPAISSSAGARALAVVRALAEHLTAEALAAVLPALRLEELPTGTSDGRKTRHLTHGEAMELAFSLGTVGGNAGRPEGALEWSPRAAARTGELDHALAHARKDEDSASRETRRLERTLANLRAVRPALDALVDVARAVVEKEPLAALWSLLHGFLERWLLAPGGGVSIPELLAGALEPACASPLGEALTGPDALAVIEERLRGLRLRGGRFGQPAVYVGTVASAAGLEFSATRVLGLCEGVLPSQPHEDPVLPAPLRAALEQASPGRVLPTAEDHVTAQVHGLFAAVQGARQRVVLSAPRVDIGRTEREPGAVFIEAAAALGRPDAVTGAPAAPVPDVKALRRDAFLPARAEGLRFRAVHPVGASDWLHRVARVAPELPRAWIVEPALSLDRIASLRSRAGPLGAHDGVLGAGGPFPEVPGLAADRPTSASALQQLLQCPRMFLMRRILGWDEPAGAPSLREIDPAPFGSLLHATVEAFYREHGRSFVAGEKTLAHWQKSAAELADAMFDEFLSEYPLVGERIRHKERQRLRYAVSTFLDYDWAPRRGRRFVGVEIGFGEERPLVLQVGGRKLHVRGYIDRIDVDGAATVVRDLKSGRHHPRSKPEADPTPFRDVQLGLYQLAAKKLAGSLETPAKVVAAYAYADGHGEVEERAFRDDAAALEAATKEWLATATHLLEARAFAATPLKDDCTYCPFIPLCGDAETRRAAEGLAEADGEGALGRFRILKLGEEET